MNTQEISLLAIQRYRATKDLRQLKNDLGNDVNFENYDKMISAQNHYHSFYPLIYTYSNMLEMIELLKESADVKIILDEIDGYVVSLEMNSNNLPMVTVKALETDTKLKKPRDTFKRLKDMTEDEISKLKKTHLKSLRTIERLENEGLLNEAQRP